MEDLELHFVNSQQAYRFLVFAVSTRCGGGLCELRVVATDSRRHYPSEITYPLKSAKKAWAASDVSYWSPIDIRTVFGSLLDFL